MGKLVLGSVVGAVAGVALKGCIRPGQGHVQVRVRPGNNQESGTCPRSAAALRGRNLHNPRGHGVVRLRPGSRDRCGLGRRRRGRHVRFWRRDPALIAGHPVTVAAVRATAAGLARTFTPELLFMSHPHCECRNAQGGKSSPRCPLFSTLARRFGSSNELRAYFASSMQD